MQVGDTVWAATPEWWDIFTEPQQGVIEELIRNGKAAKVKIGGKVYPVALTAVVDMVGPPPWKREPILFRTKEEAEAAQERWRKLPTTMYPEQ